MGRHEWVAEWPNDGAYIGQTYADARAVAAGIYAAAGESGPTPTIIVLTVAHLDHTPENCADENLRAWCQRHHLSYDAKHHAQTAYATRKAAARTVDEHGDAHGVLEQGGEWRPQIATRRLPGITVRGGWWESDGGRERRPTLVRNHDGLSAILAGFGNAIVPELAARFVMANVAIEPRR